MISFLDNALFSLPWPFPLLIILASMAVIAVLAYAKRTLDLGGTLSAYLLGAITLWILRFGGFLLLVVFFISCNIVGKVSESIRKQRRTVEVGEKKGHRRDAMQVMANGLMAVIAALIWFFGARDQALIMFGAALAESTGDTFAGEIGRLSRRTPVSIRTLKQVTPGVSGGVTVLGILAAFLSSAFISLLWYVFFSDAGYGVTFPGALLVCLLGFAGTIVDSYLGATVQALYYDPESKALTEKEEVDGRKLELSRGIRWVDNDMVNLISNVFSAVFALGMGALIL